MESSKETGCQAPEGPILCINNCGFFGTAATMNMCSKCHKETILKQQHTKLEASTVENIVNSGSGTKGKEPVVTDAIDVHMSSDLFSGQSSEVRAKDSPNRCSTCHKRVGLMGFSCRCGNLFCSVHRYSDKHDCRFDYRMAAQDVIAKENPTVKAEKLDKI